jgi:hypothetical protein
MCPQSHVRIQISNTSPILLHNKTQKKKKRFGRQELQ